MFNFTWKLYKGVWIIDVLKIIQNDSIIYTSSLYIFLLSYLIEIADWTQEGQDELLWLSLLHVTTLTVSAISWSIGGIHQSSWLGFFRWMVIVFSPKWFWRDSAYLRLKFKNTKVQIVWNIKMYKNSLIFLTPIWGNINIVFGTTLILRLSAHQCECCNIELQPERVTSIGTQCVFKQRLSSEDNLTWQKDRLEGGRYINL
jgi:hypothetical protein